MSKQPPPAPTASTIGPCPTISKLKDAPVLEVYTGPSHHPRIRVRKMPAAHAVRVGRGCLDIFL